MRGNLVRRLLAFCAVTVVVMSAFAAVRLTRVAAVSAAGGAGNLELSGVPVLPGCPLGPALTFCNQLPGTTSNDQPAFQITAVNAVTGLSVSLAPVPGSSANLAASCATGGPCDFAILVNSCTGNLAAGAFCNVSFTFTPTTSGLREAVLTVTDTGGDALAINIEGTGASLSMVPQGILSCPEQLPDNAFQYCVEPVGAVSGTQNFILESANPITALNISLTGVPGLASEFNAAEPDFTIESTTCTATLPAFTQCSVSVAFTPQAAGLREAELAGTDSEGDSVAILLAGHTTSGLLIQQQGTLGGFPTCLPSAGSQFCNEPTAGSTAPVAFTLSNTSGTQVTGLTITPPLSTTMPPPPPVSFSVTSTSCSTTLAPNASCTINVAFTPLATGLLQGSIVVTDTAGDVGAINLSGTGDDFSMQIVAGQSQEVTVEQGDTATFMARLTADGVFGQNGEQVTLVCPTNLPEFTTCAYMPCPITPTIGGTVPFSILIATSTATVLTPPVTNPCDSPAASLAPGSRGPNGILRIVTNRPELAPQFPALPAILAALAMGALALGAVCLGLMSTPGALGAHPALGPRERRALLAIALIVLPGAVLSCGKKGTAATSTATPIATTTMNVVASATDSSGNSINASRGLQIVLDVIKQQPVLP
jgi:hypothetical protein